MTIHIGAKAGEIAEVVLMPGDPYRARWAAETFLEQAQLVSEVRGMLGFTGRWRGHRVTIQGSGMGCRHCRSMPANSSATTAPRC